MAEINEEIIKLVMARINTMPPTAKLFIVGKGSFSKADLMQSVFDCDDVGRAVIEMHMNYLRSVVNK